MQTNYIKYYFNVAIAQHLCCDYVCITEGFKFDGSSEGKIRQEYFRHNRNVANMALSAQRMATEYFSC